MILKVSRGMWSWGAGVIVVLLLFGVWQGRPKALKVSPSRSVAQAIPVVERKKTVQLVKKKPEPSPRVYRNFIKWGGATFSVVAMRRTTQLTGMPLNPGKRESCDKAAKRYAKISGQQVITASTGAFYDRRTGREVGRNLFRDSETAANHTYQRRWLILPKSPEYGHIRLGKNWEYLRAHRHQYCAVELGPILWPYFDGAGLPPAWHNQVTPRMAIGYDGKLFYVVRATCSTWTLQLFMRDRLDCRYAAMTDGGSEVATSKRHIVYYYRKKR